MADGKLVVGAHSSGSSQGFTAIRLTNAGTLDSSFGAGGMRVVADVTGSSEFALTIAPDDGIVMTGQSWNGTDTDFRTIRLENSFDHLDDSWWRVPVLVDRCLNLWGKQLVVPIGMTGFAARSCGGSQANDSLEGTAGADTIYGFRGDDRFFGRAGNDRLFGGPRDDILFGNGGADMLLGGDGNDHLLGGPGPDDLIGGRGRDFIDARDGYGNDEIHCWTGEDWVRMDVGDRAARDCEHVSLWEGNRRLQ